MKLLRLRNASVRAVRASNEENDLPKAAKQLSLFETQFSELLSFLIQLLLHVMVGHIGTEGTRAKTWLTPTLRGEFPPPLPLFIYLFIYQMRS